VTLSQPLAIKRLSLAAKQFPAEIRFFWFGDLTDGGLDQEWEHAIANNTKFETPTTDKEDYIRNI
jgi:hypothetical protein